VRAGVVALEDAVAVVVLVVEAAVVVLEAVEVLGLLRALVVEVDDAVAVAVGQDGGQHLEAPVTARAEQQVEGAARVGVVGVEVPPGLIDRARHLLFEVEAAEDVAGVVVIGDLEGALVDHGDGERCLDRLALRRGGLDGEGDGVAGSVPLAVGLDVELEAVAPVAVNEAFGERLEVVAEHGDAGDALGAGQRIGRLEGDHARRAGLDVDAGLVEHGLALRPEHDDVLALRALHGEPELGQRAVHVVEAAQDAAGGLDLGQRHGVFDAGRPVDQEAVASTGLGGELEPPHAVEAAAQLGHDVVRLVHDEAPDVRRLPVRPHRVEVHPRRQPRDQITALREQPHLHRGAGQRDGLQDRLPAAPILGDHVEHGVRALVPRRHLEADGGAAVRVGLDLGPHALLPREPGLGDQLDARQRLTGLPPELDGGPHGLPRRVGRLEELDLLEELRLAVRADVDHPLIGVALRERHLHRVLTADRALRNVEVVPGNALTRLDIL